MTIIQMIRDLTEVMKKTTDKDSKKKLDDVIFELKIMQNPAIKSMPQNMPANRIEAIVINLESRLRSQYPDLPRSFWMDIKKEMSMLMQMEKF